MDLAFTPEEQAFREEIRAWVHANLPKDWGKDKVKDWKVNASQNCSACHR